MHSSSSQTVYWEKQGSDRLCAVHALNSLVQGPLFSESDLATIASDLDRIEAELVNGGPGGASDGFGGALQGAGGAISNTIGGNKGSSNVDWDGNFSLPVMEKALQQIKIAGNQGASLKNSSNNVSSNTVNQGLTLVNLDKPEVKADIQRLGPSNCEEAFVCNSHRRAHWYCLRRVKGRWFDLDSLKPAPELVSDSEVWGFVERAKMNGFTVFVVRERKRNFFVLFLTVCYTPYCYHQRHNRDSNILQVAHYRKYGL